MDINQFVYELSDLIIAIFNKEAILIFSIFCIMMFALAAMAAYWAFKSGEFRDMESSKFEMLEEGI